MVAVRVFIAEDHHLVRQGLKRLIESERSTYAVVGEESDGAVALRKIKEIKPDIAVIDINMPNLTGLQIARKIKNTKLNIKIIILTMYKDAEYLQEALDAGVQGYVLKENTENDLLKTLSAVLNDEVYISPLATAVLEDRNHPDKISGLLNILTPTERKVLKFISNGMTSKEIASEVSVSPRTVEAHRSNICAKLDLQGTNKLFQFALINKHQI